MNQIKNQIVLNEDPLIFTVRSDLRFQNGEHWKNFKIDKKN